MGYMKRARNHINVFPATSHSSNFILHTRFHQASNHHNQQKCSSLPLSPSSSPPSLAPTPQPLDGVVCNIGHLSKTTQIQLTGRDEAGGAYRYLNGLDGNAVQSPGRCTRVSCAYNVGVYFCNNSRRTVKVPWSKIAKYANDIGMVCGKGVHLTNDNGQKDPYGKDHFGQAKDTQNNGQKSSKDHWSVFVNGDRC